MSNLLPQTKISKVSFNLVLLSEMSIQSLELLASSCHTRNPLPNKNLPLADSIWHILCHLLKAKS
jgi:hypothetical protein